MGFFANKQALVDYIVANIHNNGSNSISGMELNTALLGALDFVQTEQSLFFKLTADTDNIQLPTGTKSCKVFGPARLIDNGFFQTQIFPDGYVFDPATFRILFASTRGAGEVFAVDIML